MRHLKLLKRRDTMELLFLLGKEKVWWGILLLLGLYMVTIVACDTINMESPMVESIQVTGSGSVLGEPDVAFLNLGISVERNSVREARDEAAFAMQKVVDSIKSNGVAEKDIQTQNFNIQPQYDYSDNRQILRGYLVHVGRSS
ncbi:DUF541 domain-containing protein [Candidatus Poribacteria bacterium]|nr:DUF541 domain-containing protein [Candidatus Poribacteria bacterium]